MNSMRSSVHFNFQLFSVSIVFALLFFFSPVPGQTKVACVGNSITAQNPDGLGYVARLQTMLGGGYDVRNFGHSGRTLMKSGDNPFWNSQKFADVFAFQPDIVTIMLGTNDSKPWNWDAHKAEFAADLQAMADTFYTMATHPQILLVMPPHAGEVQFSIRGSIIHDEMIPQVLAVAESGSFDVIDLNTPTLSRLDLMPDEVHPGAEGHGLLADVFYEGILNYTADRHPREKLLWYGIAPSSAGSAPEDKPTLFVYPAPDSNNSGAAVIVCPGGGYGDLAIDHEGHQAAAWLNQNGITAFVLRYRFSPYRHPVPLDDAKRAMRVVRYYAADYGIDTSRIGILGFSAGGHLASTLETHFDFGDPGSDDPIEQMKSKPDFGILVYPVITLSGAYAHAGSRANLLGNNPDPGLVESLSNHLQVTGETPPTFLAHGDADNLVPHKNSELFDSALTANGVESELFTDPGKDHGYGLDGLWPDACLSWMRTQGILPGGVGVRRQCSMEAGGNVWASQMSGNMGTSTPRQIYFLVPSTRSESANQPPVLSNVKGEILDPSRK